MDKISVLNIFVKNHEVYRLIFLPAAVTNREDFSIALQYTPNIHKIVHFNILWYGTTIKIAIYLGGI